MQEWATDADAAGMRLDLWLARHGGAASRSRAAAWLERGKVFVDGEAAGPDEAGRRLEAGMRVGVWVDRPGSAPRRRPRRSRPRAICFASRPKTPPSSSSTSPRAHCRAAARTERGRGDAPRPGPAPPPARCARRAVRRAPDRSRHERAGAVRADRRGARRAEGPVRAPDARARLPGGRQAWCRPARGGWSDQLAWDATTLRQRRAHATDAGARRRSPTCG